MSVQKLTRHACAAFAAACLLAGLGTASAQIRIGVGIALPGVRIGINIPTYPQLLPVPGYPVYYAPYLDMNLFFYDGLYWVYTGDEWYSSSWYDGPWYLVQPEMVPDFILRVPIYFYRRPPPYFLRWSRTGPPHWGEHWGPRWERNRRGWDRWDRRVVPRRAPLPQYQRGYSRERYPDPARQRALENRYYRYRSQDRRDRALQPVPRRIGPTPSRPETRRPEARRPEFAPQRERGRPPLSSSRERQMQQQRSSRERQVQQQRSSRERQAQQQQQPPRERGRRSEPPR